MSKLQINPPELIETVDIFLDPNKHPVAFNTKLKELTENGMSESEAFMFLKQVPFQMEVYYSKDQGLFLVESESLDSNDIFNPYDGRIVPNPEN